MNLILICGLVGFVTYVESTFEGDVKDAHLLLYTKDNPDIADELFKDPGSIEGSHFLKGAPLKLFVHGFTDKYTNSGPWNIKNEYLKLENPINMILLDYELLAKGPDFFEAFVNAQLVSQHVAEFLDFLVNAGYVDRENIHLIGHSLGGQIIGQVGSRVVHNIGRITALDPGLPLFDHADLGNRTDPTDADFVDVIHTSANGITAWKDPCGHADFYLNGGGYQPGCGLEFGCSHARTPIYFTESLLSPVGFWGRECDSYEDFLAGSCAGNPTAIMGEHTPKETRGVFHLQTNSEAPFALGENPGF